MAGATGRVGQLICRAVEAAPDMTLAAIAAPSLGIEVSEILDRADVLVDFTRPGAVVDNARAAVAAGVHVVIGTSGFDVTALEELRGANVFFAPNFAIGAVLMMRIARLAAEHMDEVEILEYHHASKLDAPSGTAIRTRELIGASTPIHSIRLPGLLARQSVRFGNSSEMLEITHDSTSRESFVPGVLLAVRTVGALRQSPLIGLEHLLF